jgi:hypothetical protein
MRIYTAHLRPARNPVLVREGFSWAGFLFGPLWLLAKRAWIPAIFDLAAFVWLFALAPAGLLGPLAFGLALLVGLTGRDMVRWSLARRGYALSHVVAASDEDAALARLYAARADLVDSAT